jgi:hypothetical protein
MKWSLILPSRERPALLMELVESFFGNAFAPADIELLVAMDLDDRTAESFEEYAANSPYNIRIMKTKRTNFYHRDYHNELCKLASGMYIFGLNDECTILNKEWDRILSNRIEDFLVDKKDRLCYVMIDDGSHIVDENTQNAGRYTQADYGNCFPLLTRESVEKQGFYIPPEINLWGGDSALWHIWREVDNRVLWAQDIKVKHNSGHTGTRAWDYGFARAKEVSKVTGLTKERYDIIVAFLNQVIWATKVLESDECSI